MEQKRTAPRAQKTQPLTYREWKRRKQLRLARNWGLFLAGCALVVFLLIIFIFCRVICSALSRNRSWRARCYLAGAIGGGLWALVPAFFKARWGTNETLFTLMMNYIIIGVVKWLQGGPWEKIPRGSQQIEQFASNACLPRVAGVYCGWIVVLALTVFMFLYMKYTKHGYEIAVIGESENTARYAGMNVGWVIMRTMFLSGAIAGVVGFLLVSGANNTLYSGVAAGAGFTAITVAWLAQLNPFAMVGISALLAVLQKGADTLNTQMGIPASLSDVITGVLLFFMLGCEFFINYKLVFRGAEERHKRKEAAK